MKVAIIGSGGVGATICYALTLAGPVEEIVLIDVNKELADGAALDLLPGIGEISTAVVKSGGYEACKDSDVIVITAGKGRQPGQSRDDLLAENRKIMDDIAKQLQKVYRNSFVIVVSNPVDYLTGYLADKKIIPTNKLCGTGCVLDAARWVCELTKYLHVSNDAVSLHVVGKHGDGQQILWDSVKIHGMAVEEYCRTRNIEWNESIQNMLNQAVTEMGAEIIAKIGKTQYGIASTVLYLIKHLASEDMTTIAVGNVLHVENAGEVTSTLVKMGNMCISK